VERLVDKLHFKKNPPQVNEDSPLTEVTKDNLDAFAKNWEKWLPK
jgi:ribose transport system substrate-binding protein